jgi:hypothetical protein
MVVRVVLAVHQLMVVQLVQQVHLVKVMLVHHQMELGVHQEAAVEQVPQVQM